MGDIIPEMWHRDKREGSRGLSTVKPLERRVSCQMSFRIYRSNIADLSAIR